MAAITPPYAPSGLPVKSIPKLGGAATLATAWPRRPTRPHQRPAVRVAPEMPGSTPRSSTPPHAAGQARLPRRHDARRRFASPGSRPSIHRRWRTKFELVEAAVFSARLATTPAHRTRTRRPARLYSARCFARSAEPALRAAVPGLISESRNDPVAVGRLAERSAEYDAALRMIVDEAVTRRELEEQHTIASLAPEASDAWGGAARWKCSRKPRSTTRSSITHRFLLYGL